MDKFLIDWSHRRVLIVDDEQNTRKMVDRALKKLWPGIITDQAGDGIQAIQKAKEFLPHLVILDLMLPGQDGFAVLDAMTKDSKLKSALVLGITAYNSPENIKRLAADGAFACLIKPFGPEDLRKILAPYLDNESTVMEIEKETGAVRKQNTEKPAGTLVNAAVLLGVMISTFSLRGSSEAASAKMTRTVRVEERSGHGTLPFKRIAVLPFESWNEYLSGHTLSDYFMHNLVQSFPDLAVVERRELQKIFKEQIFSQTGAVNPETVNRIGQVLGVDAILIGKITTLDTIIGNRGSVSAVCRLIDTNTGQVLWSDKQNAKIKPKLIQFESSYRSPMEIAEALLDQVARKSVENMRLHFSQVARGPDTLSGSRE